MLDKQLVRGCP